jgi:hypothetical protein
MEGISLNGGVSICDNNIINLGTSVTTGYRIFGIYDESGPGNTNSSYFNTVYVGGTPSGTTSTTAAFWSNNNTSTRNYRNNILFNARSGGTTGKHYAIRINGTTSLTIDYNDYFASGTNGVMGDYGGDKTTLAAWKTATLQDASSLNSNPGFASAGGYFGVKLRHISHIARSFRYRNNHRLCRPGKGCRTKHGSPRNQQLCVAGRYQHRF